MRRDLASLPMRRRFGLALEAASDFADPNLITAGLFAHQQPASSQNS
ncbi:MAG: hypothetical protein AAFP97_07260 [Pseudomonadota bacterium]